ncbi:arsenate reductase (glutaredoxin) [Rhodospirillaceae bacterium KN72]|uniref:Arsenate reductase n=1 Tax=Pacificispira spongiicola TaxID=2729598 RepID=A0A7Y0DYD0_9PROT|nr:arsenate reductase (glutaredoxin) [Pacificispira spongiicola]NMM43843.1 arsenate reductase (glutaredoxin) [Pacificispira spongiicola]
MSVTIYHNPRCSKSRETLKLLEDKGITPEVVLYLQDAPDAATIKDLVAKLGLSSARDLMRTKEAVYKDLGLKEVSDEAALIRAMAENPVLIERPIVLKDGKARLGRPPESVLEIL